MVQVLGMLRLVWTGVTFTLLEGESGAELGLLVTPLPQGEQGAAVTPPHWDLLCHLLALCVTALHAAMASWAVPRCWPCSGRLVAQGGGCAPSPRCLPMPPIF